MEKVWEEAGLIASRRASTVESPSQSEPEKQQENSTAPPAPPPRGRFGKLWERASSLGAGVVEKISTTEPEKDRKNEEDAKKLPSPPPEPEEAPPKRFVPPLPPVRTQGSVPPQLPPRDQDRAETAAPPAEEPVLPRGDNVLFEHDHHDHPQPTEPSSEPPSTSPVKPSESDKPELVVEKPRPPVLPPRAPRHSPADIIRPGTPSAIPLPDSRPSTPNNTTKAERRTSLPPTAATPDPGRSSSPAPGSSSTPPPIPRRAPARVRPVSFLPSTPLNQPLVDLPEKKKREEAKELDTHLPITLNEPVKPTVRRIPPPPIVEVIDRPEPEIIKPISATEVEPQGPDIGVTQIAEAPSVADGSTASPVDDIRRADGDGSGLINNQNLVGDKSWEEKAWKEVVRLREEMFYARVGIVIR